MAKIAQRGKICIGDSPERCCKQRYLGFGKLVAIEAAVQSAMQTRAKAKPRVSDDAGKAVTSGLPKQYRVTRKFTGGILTGLTHTELTSVAFQVGREYRECIASGKYLILECTEIPVWKPAKK